MRIYIPILFFVIFGYTAFASSKTDSLLTELKRELARKKIYDDQKEARIGQLKASLSAVSSANYGLRYQLCSNIYEEYKVYQFDSAYVYINKMQNLSNILHD